MKLRASLLLLVFGAILPLLMVAIWGAVVFVRHERAAIERDAIGRARAAMSAIDAELRGVSSSLRALAATRSLSLDDPQAFRDACRSIMQAQPHWANVTLYSASGNRLVDASLGMPPDLPAAEPGMIAGARESAGFVVGDVVAGPALGAPLVRLYQPLLKGREVAYVLSVALRPELFSEVLQAQRLPDGWVIALADRQLRFVARIPHLPPGDPISPSFRAAVEKAPEGFFRGRTVEKLETFTPYVTSALSGWVLGIAMPADLVNAGLRQLSGSIVAGLVLALASGIALGWLVARRIAGPIGRLAEMTRTLGRPGHVRSEPAHGIDEIDRLHGALDVAHDALNERELLREREKAALQASDRAKDEFIAMLSHELRNPLAAMTNAAHVLGVAEPASPPYARARDVIARQVRHMSRLIEDLLDVNRILMGKVHLAHEPVDLAELVAAGTEAWRTAGHGGGRPIALELSPAWVNGDHARLEQVYANLLGNAVKYSPDGSALRVEVGRFGDEARLVVEDEGEGFTPDAPTWMFELFVQGDKSIGRSRGGLGIGLALVKRLVVMHGGTITAESPGPGRGARFTVALPAVAAPAVAPAAEPAARAAAARRVLIVDDNDDVSETLRVVLAMDGHEVRTERDGTAGVAAAVSDLPQVVLVDIGLPDIDGYEVARRLRADPRCAGMRLIAMTGYGQAEDRARAIEAGFDLHLTKPVDPTQLSATLEQQG